MVLSDSSFQKLTLECRNVSSPHISYLCSSVPQKNHMLLLLLLSRFSRVRLCATPQTAAHQAPPSQDSPGKNTGVGFHCLLLKQIQTTIYKINKQEEPMVQRRSKKNYNPAAARMKITSQKLIKMKMQRVRFQMKGQDKTP